MKIMIIGDGAREDAIVRACLKNPSVTKVFSYPGNAGIWKRAEPIVIAQLASTGQISQVTIQDIATYAVHYEIDLTIVGSRKFLAAGIVDEFRNRGLRIFGPTMDDARIESSKQFMKKLAQQTGIPTAEFAICKTEDDVGRFLDRRLSWPRYVVKDSDALDGRSVYVFDRPFQVQRFANAFLAKPYRTLVIEEYLEGPERSAFAFVHRGRFKPWAIAADWKQLFDRDLGPNTGGMGSAFGIPVDEAMAQAIVSKIFAPAVAAMPNYAGLLYAGLKLTSDGPKLLEFNAGFGDAETQVTLACLESDFVEHIEAAVDGRLEDIECRWSKDVAVAVTIVPWGYPNAALEGFKVEGIERAEQVLGVEVLFSGVDGSRKHGYTNLGRRVLNVVAKERNFKIARGQVYHALGFINFPGMHYRKDIAQEFE